MSPVSLSTLGEGLLGIATRSPRRFEGGPAEKVYIPETTDLFGVSWPFLGQQV